MNEYRTQKSNSFKFVDLPVWSALIIYFAISFFLYGLPIIKHFQTRYVGFGADPTVYIWAIAWWPHAIARGLNPILTTAVWAPRGYNLAWATSMAGPSLIATPVTMLFGPLVSYNILNLACPVANAFSAFLVCRRVSKYFWPSIVGGYIFGFSQYALSQSVAHLVLLFIFPAPLAILLALQRMNCEISRVTFVTLLTIVLAFEFLASTEIFATTTVFGVLAIGLSYLFFDAAVRRAIEKLSVEIAITYVVLITMLSPYLFYIFADPLPPLINPSIGFSNDLFAFFIPTPGIFVAGRKFESIAVRMGGWWEMAGYMGPGLWAVIACFTISNWHKPTGKLLVLSLALVALFSLGPYLHLLGAISIPMPWWLLGKLPLINQALPSRFGMYLFLLVALIASIYFGDTAHPAWLRTGMAMLSILFLAPDPAYFAVASATAGEPLFCRSGEYKRYLVPGDIVLFLPHGEESMSLLWQVESGFYYRIATGRVAIVPPRWGRWPILQSFDSDIEIPDFSEQLKAFLGANGVKAIIVEERNQRRWPELLRRLNLNPIAVDGVLLYRIPDKILKGYANAAPHEMVRREALASVAILINGANRYMRQGSPLPKLTPWSAQQLKVLDLPEPVRIEDANNNWWHSLWLGPAGKAEVGVGILGSYDDLQPVIKKYAPYAKDVLFPYPHRLSDPRPDESGQLSLIFDRAGAAEASTL